jgi:hypothetical protein
MIKLKEILYESESNKREFQLRDIGGPAFYTRVIGDDSWTFTSATEFAEGLANGGKLIKWKQNDKA